MDETALMEDRDQLEDGITKQIEGSLKEAGHQVSAKPTTAETPLEVNGNLVSDSADFLGKTAEQAKTTVLGGSDTNEPTASSDPFAWVRERMRRKR